jgi:hypothetical protein
MYQSKSGFSSTDSCVGKRQVVRQYAEIWLRWRTLCISRNVVDLAALVRLRFIFKLKSAPFERDKCEKRFKKKNHVDILFCSFLAPNCVQLNFEFQWHLNTLCVQRRTALRIKKCAFKRRREDADTNSRGEGSCVHCVIMCLQNCVLCWCRVFLCFVCFRSRSYPVPHRGERVKQRTVHAPNWNNSYTNRPFCLKFCTYLLQGVVIIAGADNLTVV